MTVAALIAFLQTQPPDLLVLTEWSYNVFAAADPHLVDARPIDLADTYAPCLPEHPERQAVVLL